jgi:hypothetical protein
VSPAAAAFTPSCIVQYGSKSVPDPGQALAASTWIVVAAEDEPEEKRNRLTRASITLNPSSKRQVGIAAPP